jgi:hypothetical protein
MPDIYIVTAGAYSDFHIVAVFSTQAAAARCAALMNGAVKPYSLDIPFPDPGSGLVCWQANLMYETGGCTLCRRIAGLEEGPLRLRPSPAYRLYRGRAGEAHIEVTCYARDLTHARAIAQDLWGAVKAQNLERFLLIRSGHFLTERDIQACLAAEAQRLLESE